jgi:hypothetical protein
MRLNFLWILFFFTSIAQAEYIDSIPTERFKLAYQAPSICNDNFVLSGGQSLIFEVKNVNVLGTIFSASADDQNMKIIILPQQTVRYKIPGRFGNEPMRWQIKTGTNSRACVVLLSIWSTWIDGMPQNPPSTSTENTTLPCKATYEPHILGKSILSLPTVKLNGSNQTFSVILEQSKDETIEKKGTPRLRTTLRSSTGSQLSFRLKSIKLINSSLSNIAVDANYDELADVLNIFAVGVKPDNSDAEPTDWYKVKLLRQGELFTVLPETLSPQPACLISNGEIKVTVNVSNFSAQSDAIYASVTKTDITDTPLTEQIQVNYKDSNPFEYTFDNLTTGTYTVLVYTDSYLIETTQIEISDNTSQEFFSVKADMGYVPQEEGTQFNEGDFGNSNTTWNVTNVIAKTDSDTGKITGYISNAGSYIVKFEPNGTLTNVIDIGDPGFSDLDKWRFDSQGNLLMEFLMYGVVISTITHTPISKYGECYIVNSTMTYGGWNRMYELCGPTVEP